MDRIIVTSGIIYNEIKEVLICLRPTGGILGHSGSGKTTVGEWVAKYLDMLK